MMQLKQTSRNCALLAVLAFLILPASSGNSFAAQKAAKPKKHLVKKSEVQIVELHNIEQLKEAFQRNVGKIRLVTILSPT